MNIEAVNRYAQYPLDRADARAALTLLERRRGRQVFVPAPMSVLAHFVLWTIGLAPARTFYTSAECACLERHAVGKKRLVEMISTLVIHGT
jgi:hypothetical protein